MPGMARTSARGVTLIEVLVAIFIVGIGLLSLLTLFPLGMQSMARAIRDGRSAELRALAADVLEQSVELQDAARRAGTHVSGWLGARRVDPQALAASGAELAERDRDLQRLYDELSSLRRSLPDRDDRELASRAARLIDATLHGVRATRHTLGAIEAVSRDDLEDFFEPCETDLDCPAGASCRKGQCVEASALP